MNRPSAEPGEGPPIQSENAASSASTLKRIARLLVGILVLLGCVALVASFFRPELERVGKEFVQRFGVWGMALGTFIADGFHFPVPPQFYMLLAIASGASPVPTLGAITAGSLAGGTTGYFLARRLSRLKFVARWLERSSKLVARFGASHGYRMIVIASFTPIAYSALCYLAGVYRLPKRLYLVLAVLRIPKLVFYYWLVRVGWNFG